MSRIRIILLILVLTTLSLNACAPTAAPTEAPVTTKAPEPTKVSEPIKELEPTKEIVEPTEIPIVAKDTLIIAQSVDPHWLNPYDPTAPYLTIMTQICEPLIFWSMDADGNAYIKKHLATDYRWLDETTIQFDLREGIFFSNGEPLNSEAAKVSIELLFSSLNYSQWLEGLLDHVQIVDDNTITIFLTKPSAIVESVLAWGSQMIAPKDYAERGYDEMVLSPVGTGPYIFKEHVADDHVTLVVNPTYWGGTPRFKEVIIRTIPDETARVAALEAGEIDIATFIPLSAVSRIEGNPDLEVRSVPGTRQFATHFATYNPKGEPLKDVRVRLALNYAVDRAGMCEQIFEGRCTPMAGQYLVNTQFGYNPNLEMYPYDPEKAKELLAEAGYSNGFEVDHTYTVGRYPLDKQAGEAISSYLRAVGLTVNEMAVDYPEWARQFEATQSTALYTVGFNFGQEGLLCLNSYLPGVRFRTSEVPSAFDVAVTDAGKTLDQAERIKLMQDAMIAINEEPIAIYLYSLDDLYGVQKWVEGFKPRPDQSIRLYEWAID